MKNIYSPWLTLKLVCQFQNRQYAALLLRKKLGRESFWKTLNPETRTHLKQGCLTALIAEPEKTVAQAISRLVAVLAKHSVRMIEI